MKQLLHMSSGSAAAVSPQQGSIVPHRLAAQGRPVPLVSLHCPIEDVQAQRVSSLSYQNPQTAEFLEQ